MNTNTTTKSKVSQWLSYLLKYGIPLVITTGLCYLLFAHMNFSEMVAIIRRDCDFRWIALALVISIFSHIFRAMRWRIQLKALGIDAPLFALILSIFGTYAVNLVFPRLGEIWRTGYIAQRQQAPFTTVFGSMVADRLADGITVLLITFATFLIAGPELVRYLSQPENGATLHKLADIISSPWLWIAAALCVAAAIAVVIAFPSNRVVKRIKEIVIDLWNGFAVIGRMPGKGMWLLLSIAIWGCYFTQLYVAFFSFPATTQVVNTYGITAVLVCFVLSSISMGVPSNGGIGPWQWAIIFGLSMYTTGIPELTRDYATSFANLVMGMQTLLLILLGIFTFVCIAAERKRPLK